MKKLIIVVAGTVLHFENTGQRICFENDVAPLEMNVSEAVLLGLVFNEAFTNAIKYAFSEERSGLISNVLSMATPGHYLLCISDNGIGMPSLHFNNSKPGSLGISLIEELSEDLNGSFFIENDKGTTLSISITDDQSIKRPNTWASSFTSSY